MELMERVPPRNAGARDRERRALLSLADNIYISQDQYMKHKCNILRPGSK
jgi:hypothetical protein